MNQDQINKTIVEDALASEGNAGPEALLAAISRFKAAHPIGYCFNTDGLCEEDNCYCRRNVKTSNQNTD